MAQKDLETKEISGRCYGKYGTKSSIENWTNQAKTEKRGGRTFKEGDRSIGKKYRFLLLAGRFVFNEAVTQISSIKGESFT